MISQLLPLKVTIDPFFCGKRSFPIGKRSYVVGILNLTPDSFSRDGLLKRQDPISEALKLAKQMVQEGMDILDVGGQSSRPGADPVSEMEETRRVLPVVEALVPEVEVPISVDTFHSSIAHEALRRGAAMINDITGLQKDPRMAETIAHYNASVVIMQMKGDPKTMQENPSYEDLIGEIRSFFEESLKIALRAGIERQRILLDPGVGFGKTVEHNLEILRRLDEFLSLGFPLLIGTSRKSFIGQILNRPIEDRVLGTAATTALAIAKGASFLRVHDVRAMVDVARMTEAILNLKDSG